MRVAVIGCGVISRQHLKALREYPRAEIAATCDIQADLAQKMAEEYGAESWTNSLDDVLRDDRVDAVILALPTNLRTEMGLKALGAGKHLLTEKPAAMNAAEVEALMDARGDQVVACCSSRMSLLPGALAARAVLEQGALGEIRVIHCRAVLGLNKAPQGPQPVWRLRRDLNGGGILVNWGSYDLDFLFSLLGWKLQPVEVMAQMWGLPPELEHHAAPDSNAETHAIAMVRFTDGSVLHYDRADKSAIHTHESWCIMGSRATLRMHLYDSRQEVLLDEADPQEGVQTRVLYHSDTAERISEHPLPVRDFIDAILEKRPPHTGLEEAMLLTKITDAMYESADTGKCIQPA